METLKRYFEGGPHEFNVYTQKEADDLGIEYVYWHDAKKGDWALSDDGYVGECLKILGPYGETQLVQYVLSYARVWDNPGATVNFLERKATRSYSQSSPITWDEAEVKSKRSKRFIMAYVAMFMTGGIDWKKLGEEYRPDLKHHIPERRAKHLFKQKAFQRVIQEKLVEIFKARNIDEGDVIDMFKAAYKQAKANKDPKEMRMTAEDFRDLLDMSPKTQKLLPYAGNAGEAEWEEADIDKAKKLIGQ